MVTQGSTRVGHPCLFCAWSLKTVLWAIARKSFEEEMLLEKSSLGVSSSCHGMKSTASWTSGTLWDPQQLPGEQFAARGRPLREEPAPRGVRSFGVPSPAASRELWSDSGVGAHASWV